MTFVNLRISEQLCDSVFSLESLLSIILSRLYEREESPDDQLDSVEMFGNVNSFWLIPLLAIAGNLNRICLIINNIVSFMHRTLSLGRL